MIQYIESTDSTNTFVKQVLETGRPEELSMYVAHEQLSGRGQRGNKWFSEKGKNHTATTVFYPAFLNPENQFQISKLTALAILDCLSTYLDADKLSVKWPNDVYYEGKKIAGILIETSVLGTTLDYVIAGTGINVNQESFPTHLPNPVSIQMILKHELDLKEFNRRLLKSIRDLYSSDHLENERINQRYLSRLYRANQNSLFASNGETFKGIIRGVNEYGHLLIEKENGQIQSYAFKEVEYL